MATFANLALPAAMIQLQLQKKFCSSPAPAAGGEQAGGGAVDPSSMGFVQRQFCAPSIQAAQRNARSADESALSSQAQSYLNSAAKWDFPTIETPQLSTHSQML
jgi:hypothetical protein